jgi:hypothetical protein
MDVPIMVDTPDGLKGAWKPGGKACPHLTFDGVKAKCAIHDRPEYKGSPCWIYGNSQVDPDFLHKRGKPCLVGEAYMSAGGFCKIRPEMAVPIVAGDLEVLGSWEAPMVHDEWCVEEPC